MFTKIKKLYNSLLSSKSLSPEEKMLLKLRQLNDFENFVLYFKSHEIDPNFQDPNGLSLLMICVNPNLPDSQKYAEFLLEAGADLNKQDKSGRTAFLMVCHWEETELIDLFLKKHPNLNLGTYLEKNVFPTNPVVSCLWKENYELAETLFRKGACPFQAEQILKRYSKLPEKTHRIVNYQKRWKSVREPILMAREAQKYYLKDCRETRKPIKKSIFLVRLPPSYFKYLLDFIV